MELKHKSLDDSMNEKDWLKKFSRADERQKRLMAAKEARNAGYGGVSYVSKLTGLSRTTIYTGLNELLSGDNMEIVHIRRTGGGRKSKLSSSQIKSLRVDYKANTNKTLLARKYKVSRTTINKYILDSSC